VEENNIGDSIYTVSLNQIKNDLPNNAQSIILFSKIKTDSDQYENAKIQKIEIKSLNSGKTTPKNDNKSKLIETDINSV
jgi:hypothetical protein